MRALVVRAVIGDLLRARAQAGHGNHDRDGDVGDAILDASGQGHFDVEEALDARHRRRLRDEVRIAHLDAPGFGLELRRHVGEQAAKAAEVEDAVAFLEQRDESRHVGALDGFGQVHVHVPRADAVLRLAGTGADAQRMTDAFDTHALDGQVTQVRRALHIGQVERDGLDRVGSIHGRGPRARGR